MKKKYFFFDIDGTLTDRTTGIIVPSALEAIQKLQAAGHFVSLATGRAFYKAEKFRKLYDREFPNMVCNGGHGIFYQGALRENKPIDYEKSLAIYRQAIDLGYGVYVALDDSDKVYANSFRFFEQSGIRKEKTTYIIDEDFDPANYDKIYKLYLSIPAEEEERLTLRDTVGHMRFESEYLMFQPDAKKDGILRMLEYVGGNPEDVIVFGDDTNDVNMFDERFYKVAVGNACDSLKEQADFIAEKNIEDGIYKACEAHGWFQAVDA